MDLAQACQRSHRPEMGYLSRRRESRHSDASSLLRPVFVPGISFSGDDEVSGVSRTRRWKHFAVKTG